MTNPYTYILEIDGHQTNFENPVKFYEAMRKAVAERLPEHFEFLDFDDESYERLTDYLGPAMTDDVMPWLNGQTVRIESNAVWDFLDRTVLVKSPAHLLQAKLLIA